MTRHDEYMDEAEMAADEEAGCDTVEEAWTEYTDSGSSADLYSEESFDWLEAIHDDANDENDANDEPAPQFMTYIDVLSTDEPIKCIEEVYHTFNINKALMICESPDAATAAAASLNDHFHSVAHITMDLLDDERPLHMERMRAFETGHARVLLMSMDTWMRLDDWELEPLRDHNLLITLGIQDTAAILNKIDTPEGYLILPLPIA